MGQNTIKKTKRKIRIKLSTGSGDIVVTFRSSVLYRYIYDKISEGELNLSVGYPECFNQRRVTFYRDHKNRKNCKMMRDYPDNPVAFILSRLYKEKKRISMEDFEFIIKEACAFSSARKSGWGHKYIALLELFKDEYFKDNRL